MRDFVPTAEGMVMANPCFISTVRTTVVDIMTTTNTFKLSSVHKVEPAREQLLASLPYSKVKTLTFEGVAKASTKFQKLKGEEANSRKKGDLRRDRDVFYAQHNAEKQELGALKAKAAVKIQAAFRGYRKRPKHRYIPRRKTIPSYTQNEMQDELCNLAISLNLKPIPGLSLEARTKASKRRLRIENAAAFRLQRFFRMIFNRKLALVVVKTKVWERQHHCARVITKAVRFVITRKFVKRVEIIKRERSVVVVQAYVRKFLARKRVKALVQQQQRLWKQTEAAIIIQRNLGERHRGSLRFARATMASLRSFRKLLDITITDVVSIIVDEYAEEFLDTYCVQLLAMRDLAAVRTEEVCLEATVQDMFTLGLAQHLAEQLRLLEEENRRQLVEQRRVAECAAMTSEELYQRQYAQAMLEAHALAVEKERKRTQMFKLQKAKVVEWQVQTLVDAALTKQVKLHISDFEARAFKNTVRGFAQKVLAEGLEQASATVLEQFLRDLAMQTSMVIQDVSSRIAEDSISVALSIFTDKLSFFGAQVADIAAAEAEAEASTDSDALVLQRAEDDLESRMDDISMQDEVASVVMEMDDDLDEQAMAGRPSAKEAMGTSVEDLTKGMRGTTLFFTQARYEAALQDLLPSIAFIESKITQAFEDHRAEEVMVKMGSVLSIMLLLKSRCLFALARYEEALPVLQEVRGIRSEAFPKGHYLVGEELATRGDWHRAVAQYAEADELLEQADGILSVEMRAYDEALAAAQPGHLSQALFKIYHRALICRAELMRHCGQYYKAHALLLRIEAGIQRFKKAGLWSFEVEEDFMTTMLKVYVLTGRRQEAENWHRNLLVQRQQRYRDRHPKIASSLCALARLSADRCDLAQAVELVEEGVRMRYEFYSPQHPAVAAAHLDKAHVLNTMGKCHDAFLEAVRALNAFQQTFAPFTTNHPAAASSLAALGTIQIGLGEPMLAHNSLEQALAGFRASFTIDLHEKTVGAQLAQALAKMQRGMFVEALVQLETVVEQRQRMLQVIRADKDVTHEPLDLLVTRAALGHCLGCTGQLLRATHALPAAVKALTAALGSDHLLVAQATGWLAQLAKVRGNYADARALCNASLDALSQSCPAGHPLHLPVFVQSADILRMPGFYEESLDVSAAALNMATQVFVQSPSNVLTAGLLVCRGEALRDAGFFDEAEQLLLQSLNILRQKAGAKSGAYASALVALAEHYHQQRRWSLAERHYLQAFKLLQANYGPRSVTFETALAQYAMLLMDVHHWAEALELLQNEVLPALAAGLSGRHPLVLHVEANVALARYMLEHDGSVSLADSQSLGVLSDAFLQLPTVQALLSFWHGAGFSQSHPWIVRLKHLPELLSASLAASLAESSSVSASRSYYSGASALSAHRSALSVISEREESVASHASFSPSRSQTEGSAPSGAAYSEVDDALTGSLETGSQSSRSIGTSYFDYDASHASASFLSPRSQSQSQSYASYTAGSLSPRSAADGHSVGGSPRSVLTGQSSSLAASFSPSHSSVPRSRLINVDESTLESWDLSPSRSLETSNHELSATQDDGSVAESQFGESQFGESQLSEDLDSLR